MTEMISDRRCAYLVAHLVAYTLGVKSVDIMARDRGSKMISKGRHLSIYLAHISLGWSISRVASAFERDRSTVAYACQTVEAERDDEAFDLWINDMEDSLVKIVPLARGAA